MDQRRAGRQGGAEQVGGDLVVGAAEDGAVGRAADAGGQRLHVGVDEAFQFGVRRAVLDQPSQRRAGFGEHGDILAALVDLDLVDAAGGGGGGGENAEDIDPLDLVAATLGLVLPGHAGGRLDGGDDDAQDVDRAAQLAAVAGQPGLLQPAQGHRGGGVAGQDHQVAAVVEQAHAAGPGQLDDLLAGAAAIGGVGLVGQVGEVGARQPPHQRLVHGQSADAGVENANGHGLGLLGASHAVHAGYCRWPKVAALGAARVGSMARAARSSASLRSMNGCRRA